jgi:hypothetical protein
MKGWLRVTLHLRIDLAAVLALLLAVANWS